MQTHPESAGDLTQRLVCLAVTIVVESAAGLGLRRLFSLARAHSSMPADVEAGLCGIAALPHAGLVGMEGPAIPLVPFLVAASLTAAGVGVGVGPEPVPLVELALSVSLIELGESVTEPVPPRRG